jgi:hypothetical protein
MSCPLADDRLTGYFDGELEAVERGEMEKHISTCSDCLRELEEIKSASLTVRGLARYSVPKSVTEGMLREVARPVVPLPSKSYSWMAWTLTAAASIFVVANVVYFRSLKPPQEEQGTTEVVLQRPVEDRAKLSTGEFKSREVEESLTLTEKSIEPLGLNPSQDPVFYSVVSSQMADARERVELALQRVGVVEISTGVSNFDESAYAKDTCIEVEVTQDQLETLGKQLEGESGLLVWLKGGSGYRRGELNVDALEAADVVHKRSLDGADRGREPEEDLRKEAEGKAPAAPEKKGKQKSETGKFLAQSDSGTPKGGEEPRVRIVIYFHEFQRPKSDK